MNFKPVTVFTDKTPSKPRTVTASTRKAEYHSDQLDGLNKNSEYPITVQFHDADGNKTKWMDINQESIPVIISFLESMKKGEPKEVSAAAEEPKEEKKDEPKDTPKEMPKDAPKDSPKAFNVKFDGNITVTDGKGEVVLTLNAPDLSPEDIDKLKSSDIKSLAEKFTKIKELGLTLENTNLDFGDLSKESLPPPEAIGKDAAPSDDKPLGAWATNKLKSIEAKVEQK